MIERGETTETTSLCHFSRHLRGGNSEHGCIANQGARGPRKAVEKLRGTHCDDVYDSNST
jgi:hypothetical protein